MRSPYEQAVKPMIDPALIAEYNAGILAARLAYQQNEVLCAEGDCYRYRDPGEPTCFVHKYLAAT